jgi:hypothetical protein
MAFQLSPGVNVTEIDLTTVVPAVSTSVAAIAGVFRWGPVGERILIDSETNLVKRFAKPTNFNSETWFTAANFLTYGNSLYVSRAANTIGGVSTFPGSEGEGWVVLANSSVSNNILVWSDSEIDVRTFGIEAGMYINQSANTDMFLPSVTYTVETVNSSSITLSSSVLYDDNDNDNISESANTLLYFATPKTSYSAVAVTNQGMANDGIVANLVNQIVKNENHYIQKDGTFDEQVLYVAKYPGSIGNSLRISVCDSANAYESNVNVGYLNYETVEDVTTYSTPLSFKIDIGSRSGTVTGFIDEANAAAFGQQFSIGDQVLTGNSQIGYQYMQITDVVYSTEGNYNPLDISIDTVELQSNTIIANTNFIVIANNTLVNGEVVTYEKHVGETTVYGLTDQAKYFIVEANTSGVKLSETYNGTSVDISDSEGSDGTLIRVVYAAKITFQDPYNLHTPYTTTSLKRKWEFFNVVDSAPGQSSYVQYNGNTSAQDELHIVVVDDAGKFSGTPGTILEVYKGLSRATDAKNNDNTGNYYKDVINQGSQYFWWANDLASAPSANAMNVASSENTSAGVYKLKFGTDGTDESNVLSYAPIVAAYDLFKSAEDVDISLILAGRPLGGSSVVNGITVSNFQIANYIIDNICEIRKDCIVLISPDKTLTLNSYGNEVANLAAWRGALRSTSYAVLDSGYKYQYDRYNDVYRWIPLNGDVAGLCARTDQTNDAWWSPAGFNRGQIKNIVKLAFNPSKAERDVIYAAGVNPVVSFQGQGTILYGDKTLQSKPSAFDRINVRRLFIVLEKAIAVAAKYSLFEFNDAFTRAQFKNLVQPYLRNIQGRRGITDFKVVCDETNNTPQVIDSNQFVGDIYIKPARSINFIQLNFVAVATGVQFSEVVGKF